MRIRILLICLVTLLATSCKSKSSATPVAEVTLGVTAQPTLGATIAAKSEPTAAPTPTLTQEQQWVVLVGNVAQAMATIDSPDGDIAATVNGESIPISRLRQGIMVRLYTTPEELWTDWYKDANASTLKGIASQVLEQLINMEILVQQAKTEGISPSDAEIAVEQQSLQDSLVKMMPYDSWEPLSQETGIQAETLKLMAKQSLVLEKMLDKHVHLEDVEQVHAAHILVKEEDQARELVTKIANGEDFGELAKVNSVDRSNADKGGDLGWFPRGVMVPDFEKAAFALEPGQVSDPVQTQYGYHLIKLLGKETRPLEGAFADQAKFTQFNEWFMTIRDAAQVERYVYPLEK